MDSVKLISLPKALKYIDANNMTHTTTISTLVQIDCYIYDIVQSSVQTIDKIINYAFLHDEQRIMLKPAPITFLTMTMAQ